MESIEVTVELMPDKKDTKFKSYLDPKSGIAPIDFMIEQWVKENCSGSWKFVCRRPGYDEWHAKLVYEFSDINDLKLFRDKWCGW